MTTAETGRLLTRQNDGWSPSGLRRETLTVVEPVFIFEDPPTLVVVYESFEEASVESFDVPARPLAFTASGRVITVTRTADLWAHLELTDRYDLPQLRLLLQHAHGPTQLAGDPVAYAKEWIRLDDISAALPPFLPATVHNWLVRRRSARR